MEFGNWKGVRVGLYCYNVRQAAGSASFDDFTYRHDGPARRQPMTPQEAIVSRIATTSFPDRTFTVRLPEKADESLRVIQQAIDSCSWLGGGTVRVTAGHYPLNGPLRLKSDVNLHLLPRPHLHRPPA